MRDGSRSWTVSRLDGKAKVDGYVAMAGVRTQDGKDAVALVTGAAGDIGAAICDELVTRGYRLIACDRRREELEKVCSRIGDAVEPLAFDLLSAQECARAIGQVSERHSRLDALVNNAGAWFSEPVAVSSDEHWEEVLGVNVVAPARLSRLALPLLQRSPRGRIVMMGSKNGLRAEAGMASYDASKAALSALTRSLAVELAPLGILVNCVSPGVIFTRSNHELLDDAALSAAYRGRIPLARFGTPQDVARAVAFFCGGDCAFATGSTFVMDGGQLAGDPVSSQSPWRTTC